MTQPESLLTLTQLVAIPHLKLRVIAGRKGLDRPVRWAHSIELLNPRRYLRGEEFVLTLGSQLVDDAACSEFVDAVLERNASGIGFGVGNYHRIAPEELRRQCDRRGLPLIEVPVDVPFLAIIEYLAERRADLRTEGVRRLRRREWRLLAAVEDGHGLDGIADILRREFDSGFVVTDMRGDILARSIPAAIAAPAETCIASAGLASQVPDGVVRTVVDGVSSAFVPIHYHQRFVGWIGWIRDDGITGDLLQVLHEAAPLIAMQLDSRRVAEESDRRAIGTLMRMVMESVADPIALRAAAPDVELFDCDLVASAWLVPDGGRLPTFSSASMVGEVPGESGVHLLAITGCEFRPQELAPGTRVGIGSPVSLVEIGRSLRESQEALRLTGAERTTATWRELTTLESLLEQVPPERTMAFATQLIVPLLRDGHGASSALVDTLRAFLDVDGRAEDAAVRLGLHANSVRHRLHKIQQLVGKDPFNFFDRTTLYVGLWAWDRQVLRPGIVRQEATLPVSGAHASPADH